MSAYSRFVLFLEAVVLGTISSLSGVMKGKEEGDLLPPFRAPGDPICSLGIFGLLRSTFYNLLS
jgi:hypothetical protein